METRNKKQKVIPSFDLQRHHNKVRLPEDIDIREISIKHHVFPIKLVNQSGRKRLLLAMRNPNDQELIYEIEFRAGVTVVPVYADDIDIQWLIQKHYYGRPLTPTPTNKPREVTHDMFEQLSIVTDASLRPDWINENIEMYEDRSDDKPKS